jgi:hypothetical protein
MPIYEITPDEIKRLAPTTFATWGIRERSDLQRLLREHIEVIAPKTLVISEEFGDWDESRRRIDLLALDKAANLLVIELKRTEDGGHMELQAVRYASMVARMTFDQVVDVFDRHLAKLNKADQDARTLILEFLDWEEADELQFAQDVRIILASHDFSKELTSSVLWLIEHGVDIRCVRLKPYKMDDRLVIDVQQIIPLPEATDYQLQVREKALKERQSRGSSADFTRFDIKVGNKSETAMWKRNAVFLVCKHLCDNGTNPDEVSALIDWRRIWYMVEGDLDAEQFDIAAKQKASAGGPAYSARRWFNDDDQLIHWDGRTYALSTQWGGEGWHNAMRLLQQKYPAFNIEYTPTETQ